MHTAVETSPGAMKPTVPLGKRRVSYRSPTRAGRLRYSSSEKSHMVASFRITPLSRERLCGNTAGGLKQRRSIRPPHSRRQLRQDPAWRLAAVDLVVHDYAADGFAGHFGFI